MCRGIYMHPNRHLIFRVIIRWMNVKLAPCISIHGVLVMYKAALGVLIGVLGIGKSDCT